jgi:hypothetical protein
MPRTRKNPQHRLHRRPLREADLPSVPELTSSLTPHNRAEEPRTVAADADPTEDAIRKMIEAAYT